MKNNQQKNKCNIDFNEIAKLKNILKISYNLKELDDKTEILKALADPSRLQILYLLSIRDLYVCEIMEILEKPQSTTSHHLNMLKKAGFIEREKQGVWTLYKLKNSGIIHYIDTLCQKD